MLQLVTFMPQKMPGPFSGPGLEVGRSREEHREAAGFGRGRINPAAKLLNLVESVAYPAPPSITLVVVGAFAMFGEVEPFAFGFFARA